MTTRRYAQTPKKDLSQTLSGVWLSQLQAQLATITPEPGQLRLIAYLRLSVEKLSEANHLKALQRQWATCLRMAEKLGGVVVAVRADIAKSSDSRKGKRPEFEAMLQELPTYDGLVGHHFWRISRDPEDVTTLIPIYEKHGNLKFATPQENLDLTTLTGRAAAYGAAQKGLEDLAEMSLKQSDRHAQLREDGRYVGPPMFGVKGEDNDQEDKPEADLLRKAATDILQGKAVWEVQREWEAAGIKSPRGTFMCRSSIRNMLLSPRMMGYLVHKPKKGEPRKPIQDCWVPDEKGEPTRSQVPAILAQPGETREEREAVWRALITELSGRGERERQKVNTRASYPLSGLCWGVSCGTPMNGQWVKKKGHHIYRCLKGCCVIHGPHLDRHIGDLLVALWTERAEAVIPEAEPFTQQADLDYWTAELEKVDQLYRAKGMTLDEKLAEQRTIKAQLAPLEKAWEKWNRATAVPAPVHTVDQWLTAKAAGDIAAMRRMAKAELERVDVSKCQHPGLKGFDPSRVAAVWRPSLGVSSSGPHP